MPYRLKTGGGLSWKFWTKSMNFLLIGKLIKPYGLKGLIKAIFYVDSLKELKDYSHFYIKAKNDITGYQEIIFDKITDQQGHTIVHVAGCDDRNASELMGNREIFVSQEEVPELKKNIFYIKDLYGMEVFEKSAVIGVITNVLMIANKAMLIIKLPSNRELAVPFNDKYIGEVDIKNRIVNALNLEELL